MNYHKKFRRANARRFSYDNYQLAAAAASISIAAAADQEQEPHPVVIAAAASTAIAGKTETAAVPVAADTTDQKDQEDKVTAVIIPVICTAAVITAISSS